MSEQLSITSDLSWNEHILSMAKSAKESRVDPGVVTVYKAKIRPWITTGIQAFSCLTGCNSETSYQTKI